MTVIQIPSMQPPASRRTLARGLILTFLTFVSLAGLSLAPAAAQTVSHPVSEITTAARYYAYTHMLSPTEKKDIKYIIVRASNGDIKTVFNACDVCYLAYKGYSQAGSDLRCNNCGNRFAIDTLGGRNTAGTCHPGYLAHRIENDNVVIDVADLLTGLYYFKLETVTSVSTPRGVADGITLRQGETELTVTLPREARRDFRVYSLLGKPLRMFTETSRQVRIPIHGLVPGVYFLAVQEGSMLSTLRFIVD